MSQGEWGTGWFEYSIEYARVRQSSLMATLLVWHLAFFQSLLSLRTGSAYPFWHILGRYCDRAG
jgi:hypothetical protein